MSEFAGKVAIVTGAGIRGSNENVKIGIGPTIAKCLADHGAKVVLVDITSPFNDYPQFLPPKESQLEQVADDLRKLGHESISVKGDVGIAEDVDKIMNTAIDRFGRIDILVNNAGICILQPLIEMDEKVFDLTHQVIVKGSFLCSRAAARIMIDQGEGGRIINISSILGKVGSLFCGAYSAAKAAVIGMSRVMAQEWAHHKITVNTICPGFIETHLLEGEHGVFDMGSTLLGITPEKQKKILLSQVPAGRFGIPQDVAEMVMFLSSPKAEYITGQAINVDGGTIMY
ncbi:SDR family NAD(P)-dependent oxidoreductase [Thermodesulfobacteriota bacterium]